MTALIGERFDESERYAAHATTGRVGKSGDRLADGVLSGYEWKGGTLTYAFPDSASDYAYGPEKNNGFFAVNTNIQNAARRVLDTDFGIAADDGFSVEGFTNINISESVDHANADIRFSGSSSANPTAYAYYPAADAAFDNGISGDVWFGTDYAVGGVFDTPTVGTYGFATVLHEIGHALGLKHGHKAVGFDKIKTELQGKYDSLEYSVMTYHSYAGVKEKFYTNEQFGYPQSYMMADIRALQHMYGADFSANSGDTTYRWSPANGNTVINNVDAIAPGDNRIFATIWDGNGNDTYDLSLYSTRVVVDLRPGRYSVFSEDQRVDLGAFDANPKQHLADGNIYNALLYKKNRDSLIEDAVGGAANDKLIGNAADNQLTGNGGDDTFVFRKKSNADTIFDFGAGDDQINLKSFDIRNFNALVNKMEDLGGDVVIKFGKGDTLIIESHTIAELDSGDFIL